MLHISATRYTNILVNDPRYLHDTCLQHTTHINTTTPLGECILYT